MTLPFTRILAATDMSARSDRAVERALQLGSTTGLPVDILLVLDDALPEDLLAPLHDKAEAQLKTFCDRNANGARYSISIQPGDPTEEILKGTDGRTLLVMGPHRPRPFLDALRETTMQRVTRRTNASVLLSSIPVVGPYGNILSLVDFGPSSTAALKLGAELAPDAPLTAAHAITVPYAGMLETTGAVQMDLQASFLHESQEQDKYWRSNTELPERLADKTILTQAPPLGLVHELTRGGQYDLITAGAHGRVGAARSILGSLALDLIRDPPCDVLLTRA
jgi:nucleotide-binding universal stress UspA family protein